MDTLHGVMAARISGREGDRRFLAAPTLLRESPRDAARAPAVGLAPPGLAGMPIAHRVSMEPGGEHARPRHHRILVVDDDARARAAMARILEDEGYDAAVAADGEEATGLLASWRPDLVVTDLQMPRLDGCGLLRRVHAILPGTPVIVVSAGAPLEARRLTAGMAVSALLAKPVQVGDLLARVRTLVGA
jgi:CheY-like chemotaxis protein